MTFIILTKQVVISKKIAPHLRDAVVGSKKYLNGLGAPQPLGQSCQPGPEKQRKVSINSPSLMQQFTYHLAMKEEKLQNH